MDATDMKITGLSQQALNHRALPSKDFKHYHIQALIIKQCLVVTPPKIEIANISCDC